MTPPTKEAVTATLNAVITCQENSLGYDKWEADVINNLPVIRHALESLLSIPPPAVDLRELKAEIRAWRYPDGHSGIPSSVYMAQHISDEQLIDFLNSRRLLQARGE